VANQLARQWKAQNCLAGRFFFSRDMEQTRTSTYFFSTIAQQGLSHLSPAVRTVISNGIRDLCDPVSASLEEQCSAIFVRPLELHTSKAVLVLDALDECDPTGVTRLFRTLLPQLSNLPHLKLFVTSRPEYHITEALRRYTVCRVSLLENQEMNQSDVKCFMYEELKVIPLPAQQIEQLVIRSEGLFIWASTVCKLLQKFRGDRNGFISDLMIQGPQKINPVYQVALKQAISSDEENLGAYKKILSVIVAAFEPLSPDTINSLLDIQNAFEMVQDLQSVLNCHSPDEPVRFLHPTFREFLLQKFDEHPCCIDVHSAQLILAEACLDVMAQDLRWDLCHLFDDPLSANDGDGGDDDEKKEVEGIDDDDKQEKDEKVKGEAEADHNDNEEILQSRLSESSSYVLRYSCQFWGQHSSRGSNKLSENTSMVTRLDRFFSKNLLDWMYIISFIKSMKDPWTIFRHIILTYSVSIISVL
jgi:hypothetical protein